jgi:hypothetical protein
VASHEQMEVDEIPEDIVVEVIDGEKRYYNKDGHPVAPDGVLIREACEIDIVDYTIDGVNAAMANISIPGTTIVRTREDARRVVDILMKYPKRIHAWDTETIGVDPTKESVIGKGSIICASAFVGPDVDFGNGPRLFIDNYADSEGVIMEFKEYLEDPKYYKSWHNYGFDRHIFYVRILLIL